ncbi:hypothetical protein NKH77_11400 [Streptomyces sp. M19]
MTHTRRALAAAALLGPRWPWPPRPRRRPRAGGLHQRVPAGPPQRGLTGVLTDAVGLTRYNPGYGVISPLLPIGRV